MPKDWLDTPPPGLPPRSTGQLFCATCDYAWEAIFRLDNETGEYWSDNEFCPLCGAAGEEKRA
jgi:hypothetical protein